MKRKIIVLLLIISAKIVLFGQNQTLNYNFFEHTTLYLEAYSKNNPEKIFRGSGFVVRKGDRRFLITNFHLIDNKDYYSQKEHLPKGPYDILRIWNLCSDKQKEYFEIEIRKIGKEYFYRNEYCQNLTDLIAIEIPRAQSICTDIIDYCEFEKDKKEILKLNSEVIISGYPNFGDGDVNNIVLLAQIISEPKKDMIFPDKRRLPLIKVNEKGTGGLSGSPVFTWSNNLKKYVFIGVYSASDENGNGFFWRPDIVKDLIEKIK